MKYIISEKGARKDNEDSYCIVELEDKKIYIVADGCGGYSSGKIASQLVVDSLSKLLVECDYSIESIKNVLNRCNIKVLEEQKQYREMRTTVAGLVVAFNKAFAFNVGDSRLYQIREGNMIFHTEDHSVPYLLFKAGIISRDEINTHEDRNKLLEVLGNKGNIKVNVYEIKPEKNDVFILATDGFWEHFYKKDFLNCRIDNLEMWLRDKKHKIEIKNNSDQDNYTAIVVGGINE